MLSDRFSIFVIGVAAAAMMGIVSCKARNDAQSNVADAGPSGLNFCAAVQGNGTFIFTHFGALSRIVEDYGEIDAIAGGSSGSITAFLYESILQNPDLDQNKGSALRNDQIALLIKSLMAHLNSAKQTNQLQGIIDLIKVANEIEADKSLSPQKIANVQRASIKIHTMLSDPTIRSLVNPAVLAMLADTDGAGDPNYVPYANPGYKIDEIVKAASVLGAFKADDPTIFFREGILSFAGLTQLLGGMGNFYAGADTVAAPELTKFIKACATSSHGKVWDEVTAVTTPAGTCGELMTAALNSYWPRWDKKSLQFAPGRTDRLEQTLGQTMPNFVPSAYLTGTNAIDSYNKQLKNYRNDQPIDMSEIKFTDVRFGYFVPGSHAASLTNTLKNDARFSGEPQMQKADILNDSKGILWKEVLQLSPLEPGLGRIKQVSPTRAFIGGWADLHPTKILRAAGCENIIFVTRRGAPTSFVSKPRSLTGIPYTERLGIAELLNMDPPTQEALYFGKDSSFNHALAEANAVWCTDWDSAKTKESNFMFDHSFGKTISKNGFMTEISLSPRGGTFFNKPGVTRLQSDVLGCTPP